MTNDNNFDNDMKMTKKNERKTEEKRRKKKKNNNNNHYETHNENKLNL